jgi:hypothetical protein
MNSPNKTFVVIKTGRSSYQVSATLATGVMIVEIIYYGHTMTKHLINKDILLE